MFFISFIRQPRTLFVAALQQLNSLRFYSVRRKAKAPLPPPEPKNLEIPSLDEAELTNFTMEQKENIIDKDIELSVVLPGDVIKSTTVNGRKPMMDLLIFLCAQYHLNPSSYTIDLMSAENSQIKFKPNTPVGMLEVEKVILKPKLLDKKKPAPMIPEQTVRVVVNYKKTQKTVIRVSPHAPLQELTLIICSKCEFDPLHTVLLKNNQSQEPLDMTKSLNDLGLRELYAMDVSRDSCQMSPNLDMLKEKENKGFFSFFQRSKKKREQTASAPATPLMSKQRPAFITRSSTVVKQYDSNTLPSEMPKKRRAPLPPMPASQSVPQDLAHSQGRPTFSIMKSSSVDESDQGLSTVGIVRTGSLQLGGTSSVNSSLRRTKRKAPSPPSRVPQDQSDHSNETASESADSIPAEGIMEEMAIEVLSKAGNVADRTRPTVSSCASQSSEPASQNTLQQLTDETNLPGNTCIPDASEMPFKSGLGPEYSLDEIDEKEEMSLYKKESESADAFPRMQEVTGSFIATDGDVPLDTEKKDPASSASISGSASIDNSQISKEEKQENMSTDGNKPQSKIGSLQVTFENDRELEILDQNKNDKHIDTRLLPTTTVENKLQMGEINTVDVGENKKLEVGRLSNCHAHNDVCINHEYNQMILGIQDQKLNQANLDIVKTQDVAIQTTPFDSSFGRTITEMNLHQDNSSSFKRAADEQNLDIDSTPCISAAEMEKTVHTSTEITCQKPEVMHDKTLAIKSQSNVHVNDSCLVSSERDADSSVGSPTNSYPLYRQGFKPKPKPSNEITRDYIPKIGMTTYKIVPPKSLEILKSLESETMSDTKDQEGVALGTPTKCESSKEFGVQTETPCILKTSASGLKYEAVLAGNDQLCESSSITDCVITSQFGITTESKQTETKAYRSPTNSGRVQLMVNSDNSNTSPETLEKSNALSPTTKPTSFYLQMQKRASSHYVTSAVARSASAACSSTRNESKSTEAEKNPSPDQTSLPSNKTNNFPSQSDAGKSDDKKTEEHCISPLKTFKPLSFPSCQPATLNLKSLRTFAVPKPYSNARPSPFALAVSSAVRRSQSFNKPRPVTSQLSKEESPVELSSATFTAEVKKNHSLQNSIGDSQVLIMDKKISFADNDQNRQVQRSTDHPTATFKKQAALSIQHPDPEQIHQCVLAAIRSGDAAAKLKRVGAPSSTISINGRSMLSHSYSTEAKYNH
ncbi:cordon-bleu protein-like 1 isoform X2 [Alligator mississippiensis]|uniref:cordon-bleu protein-like 1 isoform X2 n=1 Tax=Alligator mississippiensis TaxID=8496 RepID=UPI002877AF45|nr:cordon-bleu protein-like 1 isoform X2 [Alligator mississippiensis]